jgi:hypothetical protein
MLSSIKGIGFQKSRQCLEQFLLVFDYHEFHLRSINSFILTGRAFENTLDVFGGVL